MTPSGLVTGIARECWEDDFRPVRSFKRLQKVWEPRFYTVMNMWDFWSSSGPERVSRGMDRWDSNKC